MDTFQTSANTAPADQSIRTYVEGAWSQTLLNDAASLIQRNELNPHGLPAKFRPDEEESDREYVHFSNYAYFLGCLAKTKGADFCVFFHDCDDLSLERLARAMQRGFRLSHFDGAVRMTPKPTSEAWILAAIKTADGLGLRNEADGRRFEEALKPNDRNPRCAKATLAQHVTGDSTIMQLSRVDYDACLSRINAMADGWSVIGRLPSGKLFAESVREAVRHLQW